MLDKIRPASLKAMAGRNVGMRFGAHFVNSQNSTPIQADTRPAGKSSVAHLSRPTFGEESDHYPIVVQLNDRWRVVACKNSIQWILQRRRGGVDHWRGYWFCRTREALLRGAREHASPIGGAALAILLRLPERIGGAAP